jgi:hypothetical protein
MQIRVRAKVRFGVGAEPSIPAHPSTKLETLASIDSERFRIEATIEGASAASRTDFASKLARTTHDNGVRVAGFGRTLTVRFHLDAADEVAARQAARTALESAVESAVNAEMRPRVSNITVVAANPGRPRRVLLANGAADSAYWASDGCRTYRIYRQDTLAPWCVSVSDGAAWEGRDVVRVLQAASKTQGDQVPAWATAARDALLGKDTALGFRYACPCCDSLSLVEAPPGTYQICSVCRWEDDPVQYDDPDTTSGANVCSLREARADFMRERRSRYRARDRG